MEQVMSFPGNPRKGRQIDVDWRHLTVLEATRVRHGDFTNRHLGCLAHKRFRSECRNWNCGVITAADSEMKTDQIRLIGYETRGIYYCLTLTFHDNSALGSFLAPHNVVDLISES
jgi:hypothetical protein